MAKKNKKEKEIIFKFMSSNLSYSEKYQECIYKQLDKYLYTEIINLIFTFLPDYNNIICEKCNKQIKHKPFIDYFRLYM